MEFDRESLAKHDGQEGRQALVAVDGKVYDVTGNRLWKNGTHMNRHQAGVDLTEAIAASPHGMDVLKKIQIRGTLAKDAEDKPPFLSLWLINFLDAYPFFKRHPHPMVVHFPMAIFIIAPVFLCWYYLVNPAQGLLDAVFYLYILGTLSLPAAIGTGILSWLVNYSGKANPLIIRKSIFSIFLLIFDVIIIVALVVKPAILQNPSGWEMLIPALIFLCLPLVSIIGEHGGKLVFPVLKTK
ncbi:MAG TPA: cytochrome b5 domain-containing protein [Smithellaceae bacterium]|nr:cytochrome b5 domain-containing protein [Smithellaceae bacterium]HRS89735.1 cytochrome b5 domain-containing protein [Smithellaceae bacterium]HRV26592.1 cytochrome b5 domain-containing protein [Smithellaceae bacterium]